MISFPMESGINEADADKIARLTDEQGNDCFEAIVAVRYKLAGTPRNASHRVKMRSTFP